MLDAAYMMRRFGDRQSTSAIASSAITPRKDVACADAPLLVLHHRRAHAGDPLDRTVCGRAGLRREPRRHRADRAAASRRRCNERRPAQQRDRPERDADNEQRDREMHELRMVIAHARKRTIMRMKRLILVVSAAIASIGVVHICRRRCCARVRSR